MGLGPPEGLHYHPLIFWHAQNDKGKEESAV
jgi:hypothetical protein